MDFPFTIEQFLGVFRSYNEAVWPAHVAAYVLGLAALLAAARGGRGASAFVAAALAALWGWNGAVYHVGFFAEINPAAYAFGALFVLQAGLFAYVGLVRHRLAFRLRRDAYGLAGAALVLYALALYPLLGIAFGHGYPSNPAFGLAPCPTTIFTLGLLLWTERAVPKAVLVIPALWALVGFTAALQLGVYEDTGLLVAALVSVGMLLYRDRRRPVLAST
jgi:hypothetical protein